MAQGYWRNQKQRVIEELEAIANGEDHSKEIEKIDAMTRHGMKIKNFHGKESEELKYDKDFEAYCIILASHVNQPVKTLTVKEYFALRKYVDDQNKRK